MGRARVPISIVIQELFFGVKVRVTRMTIVGHQTTCKMHTGEKPYECLNCQKIKQSELSQMFVLKSGLRPVFKTENHLTLHIFTMEISQMFRIVGRISKGSVTSFTIGQPLPASFRLGCIRVGHPWRSWPFPLGPWIASSTGRHHQSGNMVH